MLIFPLFIPHRGCPQACIYCDQYQISGVEHPDWENLLIQLKLFCSRHYTLEKEIAFYGGSFTCLPLKSQSDLYDNITAFLDDHTHVRYSTRPDGISETILQDSYSHGVRTIELGIQDFSDRVLQSTRRGYSREQALIACRLVKSAGIKLSVQLMPGLPGYDADTLSDTIEDTISVQPDYVRIYPTIVIAGTPLEAMYSNGTYNPMNIETAIKDVSFMVKRFESSGIKVIKIGLTGIEIANVIAGPFHQSFGEYVRAELYMEKIISQYKHNHVLNISSKDISLLLGHKKEYLTRIKYQIKQSAIKIRVSGSLKKGEIRSSNHDDFVWW